MVVKRADEYLQAHQAPSLPKPDVVYRTPDEQARWLVNVARRGHFIVAVARINGKLGQLISNAKADIDAEWQQHVDNQPTNE